MSHPPSDPPRKESITDTPGTGEYSTIATIIRRCREKIGRVSPRTVQLLVGLVFLCFAAAPAAAQSDVGDVYCDTGVATGIDLLFGAIAGLGLPAAGIYTGKAGFSYMRAGGDLEKKQAAREKLVLSGMGFGIVTLALVSPELIGKVGSQMGFSFSDCVRPF